MENPQPTESRPVRYWMLLAGLTSLALFVLVIVSTLDAASSKHVASAAVATPLSTESLGLTANAVYVQDLTNNRILFSQNADVQLPLASITKIALVLATSEVLDPNDSILVSEEATIRGEGGHVKAGEIWRAQDLMDYTLIISSNVGAEALAEAADERLREKYPSATPGDAAVWRMNRLATELGLTRTYFLNPSGLDIGLTQTGAMSSAEDVAKLMAYAMKYPALFEGTQTVTREIGPLNTTYKAALNTNDALPDLPGLILGKTGFTDLAGGNLAIVFEIGPRHPVVAVVLGSTQEGRFEDMKRLVRATQTALTVAD